MAAAFALHCFTVSGRGRANQHRWRREAATPRRNLVVSGATLKNPLGVWWDGLVLKPWRCLAENTWRSGVTAASARREFVWLGPDDLHDSLRMSTSTYNATSQRRPLVSDDFCGREV